MCSVCFVQVTSVCHTSAPDPTFTETSASILWHGTCDVEWLQCA